MPQADTVVLGARAARRGGRAGTAAAGNRPAGRKGRGQERERERVHQAEGEPGLTSPCLCSITPCPAFVHACRPAWITCPVLSCRVVQPKAAFLGAIEAAIAADKAGTYSGSDKDAPKTMLQWRLEACSAVMVRIE